MMAVRSTLVLAISGLLLLAVPGLALSQPGEDEADGWLEEDDSADDDSADEDVDEPTDEEAGDESNGPGPAIGTGAQVGADTGTEGDAGADNGDGEEADEPLTMERIVEYFEGLSPEERSELLSVLQEADGTRDRSDAVFRSGVQALADSRYEDAIVSFEIFVRTYPEDERAGAASQLRQFVEARVSRGGVAGELKKQDDDKSGGAIEFVTISTTFGIWSGLSASVVFELDTGVGVLISGLTGLAALGGSLAYAWDADITAGDASLVSNATIFGGWNGVALSYAFSGDSEPDEKTTFGVAWGLSALGYAGALTASVFVDPDDGDVALVNSGGIWGTFYAGMVMLAFVEDLSSAEVMGGLVAGTDLGMAGMGILAAFVDTNRGRMALIDLGGLLGGLLGFGVLFAADESPSRGVAGVTMMLSAATGLGLAAWLTDTLDDKDEDDAGEDGAQLHSPTPFALPQRGEDGEEGIAGGVNVLNLTW